MVKKLIIGFISATIALMCVACGDNEPTEQAVGTLDFTADDVLDDFEESMKQSKSTLAFEIKMKTVDENGSIIDLYKFTDNVCVGFWYNPENLKNPKTISLFADTTSSSEEFEMLGVVGTCVLNIISPTHIEEYNEALTACLESPGEKNVLGDNFSVTITNNVYLLIDIDLQDIDNTNK